MIYTLFFVWSIPGGRSSRDCLLEVRIGYKELTDRVLTHFNKEGIPKHLYPKVMISFTFDKVCVN